MSNEENIIVALKKLVDVLSTGKNISRDYLGYRLYKAEIHLLEIIGEKPGINSIEIAKNMSVTKGAVSQIIGKLITKQLIAKVIDPKDPRSHDLHLTENGNKVFAYHLELEKEHIKKAKDLLQKCNPNDIQRFEEVIDLTIDFINL